MSKYKRFNAVFTVNDEFVMEICDDNKDAIIARAIGLIESALNGATCVIHDIETQTVIQTIKRTPIE